MRTVDRIDGKGDIREHDVSLHTEDRTACGLRVESSQPSSGNARCKRCDAIRARRVNDLLALGREREHEHNREVEGA